MLKKSFIFIAKLILDVVVIFVEYYCTLFGCITIKSAVVITINMIM